MEKNNKVDQKDSKVIGQLLERVKAMAEYALETNQLPSLVSFGDLIIMEKKFMEKGDIDDESIKTLSKYLEILSESLGTVTSTTILETRPVKYDETKVKNYFKKLHWLTIILIFIVIGLNFLDYYFDSMPKDPGNEVELQIDWKFILDIIVRLLVPFLYGTLGSCAYLLRVSEVRLRLRDFDTNRIKEHWTRLVLGTLSGGIVVLFITEIPTNPEASLFVTQAALGFIAGYSIDFLFNVIDRIKTAIMPGNGGDPRDREEKKKEKQDLIQQFKSMEDQAESNETKKFLKEAMGIIKRQKL